MKGELAIVGTPIGNLEDITLRALRTLREADVIVCEDTRETRKLLGRHDVVGKRLESLHARNESSRAEKVIEWLRAGEKVAYVTDAGTPGISDPGTLLVSCVREALGSEARIVAIPGPSALAAAVSIAGVPSAEFTFLGFLPHKKGRETLFKRIAEDGGTVVFYESPHRIEKTLASLAEYLPERRVVLVRELTKVYEEVLQGSPAELAGILAATPEKRRGEFVVLVAPK